MDIRDGTPVITPEIGPVRREVQVTSGRLAPIIPSQSIHNG
jgi:hypothetical protein